MPKQFKCQMCGGIFDEEWSDEEARAEAEGKGLNVDECGVVCDDCYKKTPWGNQPELVPASVVHALRDVPSRCDICHGEFSAEELEPVSGGEWVCGKCAGSQREMR